MTPERIEQLRHEYDEWCHDTTRQEVLDAMAECLNEIVSLRSAINHAIAHAAGRADEWGERAERCFDILEEAVR